MALNLDLLIPDIPRAVAFVGARKGYPAERVRDNVQVAYDVLKGKLVVVSGGANGVDDVAEGMGLELGCLCRSFRVNRVSPDVCVITEWRAEADGGKWTKVRDLPRSYPTFGQTAHERNKMVVCVADIVVAHPTRASKGTWSAVNYANRIGKPVIMADGVDVPEPLG